VGLAQKTGFGRVSPLPGIWPSLHLDTTITLPVGVEAYAAYALRAWVSAGHCVSDRTRRFAKWSAVCSLALGMAGQAAGHLLTQTGAARAPWPITTIVSCLPVLVPAMGTTLAHMLRADTAGRPDTQTSGPEPLRSACRPAGRPGADQDGPDRDHAADSRSAPMARAGTSQLREPGAPACHETAINGREAASGRSAVGRPEACCCREADITAGAAQHDGGPCERC
jgi:hypothetical protein